MSNLSADMSKCLSSNLSTHRFLFKEQLKKSRDLKGGFILDAENTRKMLEIQGIDYPFIAGEKRFHPERLRPQMEAQVKVQMDKPPEEQETANRPVLILSYYYHKPRTNSISYNYAPCFIQSVVDCRKGYRTVQKEALVSLRSRYSRLLFIYMSGNADQFTFNEATLREMFGIRDKYKRLSGIKKRLECVKKEFAGLGLDFHWAFEGAKNQKNQLSVHVKGMSQYHPSVSEQKEQLQIKDKKLPGDVVNFLKTKFGMNDKEIASNRKTFLSYIHYFGEGGLLEFLRKVRKSDGYFKARSRIGYLINAVKDEVRQEQSTGRVEGKKTDIDNMEITDPRIKEIIDYNKINKLDSS
jgi:hypothetical protein